MAASHHPQVNGAMVGNGSHANGSHANGSHANSKHKIKHIRCSGTPYQIGYTHGSEARDQVHGSIAFYTQFFQQQSKLDWSKTREVVQKFLPHLQEKNAEYVQEMQGLADGAGVDLEDIVALNVRTEIAYGLMATDGCTAFLWKEQQAEANSGSGSSFIAQNWDWRAEQGSNLINVRIEQGDNKPRVEMMTEAGIIGKIGMNSAGVGVTLNAIQVVGVDYERLPCHLALRTVLDSKSRAEAQARLQARGGVASACHIQIADKQSGGIGLENTSVDVVETKMDQRGITTHTNHLVREHKVPELRSWKDSRPRLARVGQLLDAVQKPDIASLSEILKDQQGYPCAINRNQTEESTSETLFSIVMDLTQGYAKVKIGRPTDDGQEFELRP